MKQLILFSVSIFPIILLGKWIYDKDKEKEPFELLVKLFLAGMGSCFITIVLTYILGSIFRFFTLEIKNLNIVTLIPYVFIGVALIEEFSKWIVAYIISYNDSELLYMISEANEDANDILCKKYDYVINYYSKKYSRLRKLTF